MQTEGANQGSAAYPPGINPPKKPMANGFNLEEFAPSLDAQAGEDLAAFLQQHGLQEVAGAWGMRHTECHETLVFQRFCQIGPNAQNATSAASVIADMTGLKIFLDSTRNAQHFVRPGEPRLAAAD